MSWYEQWFDSDEYDLVYQDRDDDEARAMVDLVEQVVSPDHASSVLDIGCGRGRHAVEFARRGYEVTGLDLSPRSLAAAETRASKAGLSVRFVRGDMREPVAGSFDIVVNLFTAFGYFDSDEDHGRALGAMASGVKPGGWFVQDFLNADYVRANLVPSDVRVVADREVRQTRRIQDGRVRKRIEFLHGESSHSFEESVALLDLDDLRRLYADVGLRIEEIRGDYAGGAFGVDSPRLILFARPE